VNAPRLRFALTLLLTFTLVLPSSLFAAGRTVEEDWEEVEGTGKRPWEDRITSSRTPQAPFPGSSSPTRLKDSR